MRNKYGSTTQASESTVNSKEKSDGLNEANNILGDLTVWRLHNVPKLFTHEDFHHLHKALGIASLAHYIYRMHLFLTTGSMQFDNSLYTFLAIMLHMCLSCSSMIFNIPSYRVKSGPMIYPEFRLHSIVFGMRSLVVMLLMFIARRYDTTFPLYLRGVVVIITMLLADWITRSFKEQGTTMRGMPFPEYIPENIRDNVNTYYSVSQLCATAQILFSYRLDELFLVLFPIQIAAFLMTCVRKSIISAGAWHFYYALALGLNYVCCPFLRSSVKTPMGVFVPVAMASIYVRFNHPTINKYHIWTGFSIVHILCMTVLGLYRVVLI
jgi:hypothetical protein